MLATSQATVAHWLGSSRVPEPSVPEILASDDTITLWWWDHSPNAQDRPPYEGAIATSLLVASPSDDPAYRLGHVRISYTTRDLVDSQLSNPLAFKVRSQGWCFSPDMPVLDACSQLQAHMRQSFRPAPSSETEAFDEIERMVEVLRPEYDNYVEWFRTYFAVPFVAYSHTETPRDGLGTKMYVAAAKKLAARGAVLRASGLQSDSAEGLWRRFDALGLPVREVSLPRNPQGANHVYKMLDFT